MINAISNLLIGFTPRQSKGLIIGALGLVLFLSSRVAAAGYNAYALAIAIPILTAVYIVTKEA